MFAYVRAQTQVQQTLREPCELQPQPLTAPRPVLSCFVWSHALAKQPNPSCLHMCGQKQTRGVSTGLASSLSERQQVPSCLHRMVATVDRYADLADESK